MQLTATGDFSDGSTEDLTSQVSWTSGNNAIAQVSNAPGTEGLVTGLSVGSATITVSLSGIQGSTTLIATAPTLTSLTITAPVDSIAKGTTVQLIATCNFGDGTTQDCTSQASWTSDNNAIAQVSDAPGTKGLVTGLDVGSTTTAVTLNGVHGSAAVSVSDATLLSLTITPPDPSIAKETTVQLTATANFSDGSTEDLTSQVSWTSGNNAIEQVSDAAATKGLVTGLGVGSTAITATLSGIQGSTTVTVTAPILTSLAVTPPGPSIAKGTIVQLIATGTFSDGSTEILTSQVSWTSGNNSIAQVSDQAMIKGLVFGLGLGSASITATLSGIQGSTPVFVTAPTLVSIIVTPANPTLPVGTKTFQMTATAVFSDGSMEDVTEDANWTSSDARIAQVKSDEGKSNGLLRAKNPGKVKITATVPTLGGSGSTSVTVT